MAPHPIIAKQLNDLRRQFASAGALPRADGSALIVIENFRIPDGWTRQTITLRFLAPNGFPVAPPDCFWADADLMLAGNRTPQNTALQPLPPPPGEAAGLPLRWFSWHVQGWDPNRGSLIGYVQAILQRLRCLQ